MEITPELLKKYIKGEATLTEKQHVEEWFTSGQNNASFPFPGQFDESTVRASMWQEIAAFKQVSANKKTNRQYFYSLTACMAFLIAGYLFMTGTDVFYRTISIDNQHTYSSKHYTIEDINLTVGSNSRCEIKVPVFGPVEKIRFSGAVSIMNTSLKSRKLDVRMDFKDCASKAAELIQLKKGNTYMAMTDKKYKMISATISEIKDGIPRSFCTPLIKQFNLSI